MSHAALKYVEPVQRADTDPLTFERRIAPRHGTSGRVTAIQMANDPRFESNKIFSMDLLNISDTGLGAMISEPITTGSAIRVCFTPHGADHGFNMSGCVVRCTCKGQGHEVGIRFDTLSAA